MDSDKKDSHETATCPKCGGTADRVSLTFQDDPMLKSRSGLLGAIGDGLVGTAIGETAHFVCRKCKSKSVRRAYIGGGKGWETWD